MSPLHDARTPGGLGSDGARVGTAEYLEGSDKIKLTKSDPKSGGQHHIIPLKWADTVDDKVGLKNFR